MVLAVKKFRVYLGAQFDLITDHRALQWLATLDPTDQKGRRGRWINFLQQFDMNPIHKAKKSPELATADYLSRAGADGQLVEQVSAILAIAQEPSYRAVNCDLFTKEALRRAQTSDVEETRPVLTALIAGKPFAEESPTAAKALMAYSRRLTINQDGLLC